MKAADISASAYASMAPGTAAKAIVRLDQVAGERLHGTLLRKIDDTHYALPIAASIPRLNATLNQDTSVAMGVPAAIVPGAIVQLAGTVDVSHTLHVNQIVILTGYVRLEQDEAR